jgi:hypothetical protein
LSTPEPGASARRLITFTTHHSTAMHTSPHRIVATLRRIVRGRKSLVFAVLAVAAVGCLKQMLFFGYLIGGPPSVKPDFETQTNKSLTDYEVKVAVVCYAPTKLKWDFEDVDKNVAKYVSHRLNQHKVKVISPDRVQRWLDQHKGEWDTAAEIGAAFKTTFVVDIEIIKYNLYEKGSQTLYRGNAEAIVTVWEMQPDGDGEKIYTKEIKCMWPLAAPRSTSDITYARFRMMFLQYLSERVGRLFYEHYNGDDIGEAT